MSFSHTHTIFFLSHSLFPPSVHVWRIHPYFYCHTKWSTDAVRSHLIAASLEVLAQHNGPVFVSLSKVELRHWPLNASSWPMSFLLWASLDVAQKVAHVWRAGNVYSTRLGSDGWAVGSRAINQKVIGSIPGHAKLHCVLGQGTSPYLPWGECPCTYCKTLWIRASAKCNVNKYLTPLQNMT